MALDRSTVRLLHGLTLGACGVLAASWLMPVATEVLRPLLKSVTKHGILALHAGRERLALALEGLEDLLAEVRAEVDTELGERQHSRRDGAREPTVAKHHDGGSAR